MNTINTAAWPFAESSRPGTETQEPPKIVLENNTVTGKYKIILAGRGTEAGIGLISREQYDFWSHPDNSEFLAEALNDPEMVEFENEEGEMVEIPEECRFPFYYNEYSEVAMVYGCDDDSCWITINNPDGVEILEKEFHLVVDDPDTDFIVGGEEYFINDQKPDTYLWWAQGGKGTYFEGEVDIPEGESFKLENLSFTIDDIEGHTVISGVYYNGNEVENWGGDWSGKWADYSVHDTM